MKKLLLLLFTAASIFFCSCTQIYDIENNKLVSACIINFQNGKASYNFCISAPGGDSKDASDTQSKLAVYSFEADSFSDAVNKLSSYGSQKTDVSHMSFICGNREYFSKAFADDEKHIRKVISSTALIDSFIYDGNKDEILGCINEEYKSNTNDFIDALFQKNKSSGLCTISELSLAKHNISFTAALPVVSIVQTGERGLPSVSGTALYTMSAGVISLTDSEHNIYSKWKQQYSNESRGYKLSINKNTIKAGLFDKSVTNIARKYAMMDVDILNVKYYARRCFWTYSSYEKFIKQLNLWDAEFI